MKPLMFTLAILLAPASLPAQDSVIVIDPTVPFGQPGRKPGPPEDILREAVRAYNDTGTVRFAGDVVIPRGATLTGQFGLFVEINPEIDPVGPVPRLEQHALVDEAPEGCGSRANLISTEEEGE